jgi:hypothetical protein
MSINLITDGWLHPIITKKSLTAPTNGKASVGPTPTQPCATTGAPTDPPPASPVTAKASGPDIPTAPCGTTGSDPTIDPPKVPKGQEASETGDTAPAVPRCPEGKKT